MDTIHVGSSVTIEIDGKRNDFRIVDVAQSQDPTVITVGSQIGSALVGKKVGDTVEIVVEGVTRQYKILAIR